MIQRFNGGKPRLLACLTESFPSLEDGYCIMQTRNVKKGGVSPKLLIRNLDSPLPAETGTMGTVNEAKVGSPRPACFRVAAPLRKVISVVPLFLSYNA